MKISNNRTIAELQADFNKVFPYLKVEFYNAPYKSQSLLPKSKIINHDNSLGQFRKMGKEGELELNPEISVADFEQALWQNYNLAVQVFRKSGTLWIETSLTDAWTLRQQNLEGEQMSTFSADSTPSIDLYDRDQAE